MTPRFVKNSYLAFVLACALFSTAALGAYEVHSLEMPTRIEGKWKIKLGDSSDYATATLNDAAWDTIDMPGTIVPYAKRSTGYAWLRTELVVDRNLKGRNLGLNLGRVPDVYEVYFNGIRIAGEGRFPSSESGSDFFYAWNTPAGAVIPATLIAYDRPNTIAIRLYFCNDGGIWDKLQIMEPAALRRDLEFRRFVLNDLCLAITYVLWAVAFYHFLLFVNRPGERENVFFSIFCVFISIQTYNFAIRDLPVDYIVKERVVFGLTPMFAAPGAYFFRYYFDLQGRFHQWFTRLAALIQFAGAVYIVSAPDLQTLRARYDHSIILVLISMVYIVMALVQAWRAGNIKAKYIAAGFLITILLALHDVVIVVSGVRDAIFLFNYALPSLLFCIALVLGHDFVSTHNKIEELNTNLEKKVEHRTRELRHTLDEVRELKSQQDGDYFLTSILIQPLSGIHVSASPVSIEAIVSQKKHFEFRKWTADIGGDICAAHFITLRNKRYIAFMNGDAMGKSMQGAGGALVLGTVYKAVISRTQKSSAAQGRFPEQWLKECFLELQDVFVSFDGTMLASAVLGLVDETRGLLYYINAEHPRTVLYRSGTAAFIEQEQALRKLGIAGLEGRLSIRTQKLEVNDVILIGSDGRDDLLMGIDEEKRRIINDDDSLFLKCVEEGRGELGPIKNALLKRGEITDDFSLLRIGFQEDSGAADQDHSIHTARQLMRSRMEALLQAKDFSAASTLLIEAEQSGALDGPTAFAFTKALVKAEEYALAAQTAVRYSEAFPENTDLLFQCAMTLKVVNQLGDAADYGECLLLRDPTHVNNLANLADIYRRLGNDKRARQMITRAKTLDPTNKNVATIETLMGAATPAV